MESMTKARAEFYLEQVGRLGKAKALPEEVRKKWQKEYDEIIAYLKRDFKPYLIYIMTNGRNNGDIEAGIQAAKKAENEGIFDSILGALRVGDAAAFEQHCQKLRKCYLDSVPGERRKCLHCGGTMIGHRNSYNGHFHGQCVDCGVIRME